MIASAFVQNGAKVYIVSRKEAQLKNVRIKQTSSHLFRELMFDSHNTLFRLVISNKKGPGSHCRRPWCKLGDR